MSGVEYAYAKLNLALDILRKREDEIGRAHV